eukprot:scaffold78141_cov32-Tisochrysis_lutea.AAC.4
MSIRAGSQRASWGLEGWQTESPIGSALIEWSCKIVAYLRHPCARDPHVGGAHRLPRHIAKNAYVPWLCLAQVSRLQCCIPPTRAPRGSSLLRRSSMHDHSGLECIYSAQQAEACGKGKRGARGSRPRGHHPP